MTPLEKRPGVVAIYVKPCGGRLAIGECACCGRVMMLPRRGLCSRCICRCKGDGTLANYGYVYADRIADYFELRPTLPVAQAAARVGVSTRTAERYEAAKRNQLVRGEPDAGQ